MVALVVLQTEKQSMKRTDKWGWYVSLKKEGEEEEVQARYQ